MSHISRKISDNLFTLPIDEHYDMIDDEISAMSNYSEFYHLMHDISNITLINQQRPNSKVEKFFETNSTKSNSPFYPESLSNNILNFKNKFIHEQEYLHQHLSINKKKIKLSKCVKKTWKSKLNNLRDLLAKKLLEKVRYRHGDYCNMISTSLTQGNILSVIL
jgi:hypothetical protein